MRFSNFIQRLANNKNNYMYDVIFRPYFWTSVYVRFDN